MVKHRPIFPSKLIAADAFACRCVRLLTSAVDLAYEINRCIGRHALTHTHNTLPLSPAHSKNAATFKLEAISPVLVSSRYHQFTPFAT